MQSKKWRKFDELTEKCYSNMIGMEKDGSCWKQAFELLKKIVGEEREKDPSCMSQLEMVDDATDYEHDVQGWIEECLDEMEGREDYETLLRMCDDLLDMFEWPEYSGSDIRFQRASALGALGRNQEAAEYCGKWIQKEPENILASVAGVYALIRTRQYDEAEKLSSRFIFDSSECTEENDVMFIALSSLYEAMGRKKEKRQIDKAIEEYEERMEEEFTNLDDDEYAFDDWDDGELPF